MESGDRRVFWKVDIIYQTTTHHNTEESNLHSHHHEEFKSQLSECITALMLYFSTSPPSIGPTTVLPCAILFLHQLALSSSFSLGQILCLWCRKYWKGQKNAALGKGQIYVRSYACNLLVLWYELCPYPEDGSINALDMSEYLYQTIWRRILDERNSLRME
jgi:hypothetical protein